MKSKAQETSGSEASTWTQGTPDDKALQNLRDFYEKMKSERAEDKRKAKR